MSRLGNDDYKRPKKTMQDKLNSSKEDIKSKLEDYVEVEDIGEVPLNTHLRYWTEKIDEKTKKKTKVFRLGGFLSNKNNYETYVVLSNTPITGVINNSQKTWSVNTKKSIFYRKLTLNEIKEDYKDEVEELNDEIDKLKKEIKKLKAENKKLSK